MTLIHHLLGFGTSREWRMRIVATGAGLSLFILVLLVALARNPSGSSTPPSIVTPVVTPSEVVTGSDRALAARGEQIYRARGCAGCHRLRGEGNLRNPLDGIGDRMEADEIRARIVAAESVAADMPPRIVAIKAAYRDLSREDLDALVAYLRLTP